MTDYEDEYTVYCDVCQEDYPDDNPCRHLSWNDDIGVWGGCGCLDYLQPEDYKESFLAVLEKIGTEAARQLERSLKEHRYYFQFYGPMFGPYHLTAYLLSEDGYNNQGDRFTDELTDEEEQEMSLGMQWLMSLWSGYSTILGDREPQTAEYDNITVQWVQEWLESQKTTTEGNND